MALRKKKAEAHIDRDHLIAKAVELKKSGHLDTYVSKQLTELAAGKLTGDEIQEIMLDAVRVIAENYFSRAKDVRLLHVSRYNKEIRRLLKTTELDESLIGGTVTYKQWLASRERKIKAFDKAIDTIVQLESILGLSTITHEVDINSKINVNVDINPKTYDISKLTFEEQVELLELMQKAKKGCTEPTGVLEMNKDQEIITENVIPEILPANVDSIRKIQLEESEILNRPNTATDVIARIKEKLRSVAARRMQDAGSNLDDSETQYANDEA